MYVFISDNASGGVVTTEHKCLQALRKAADILNESPTKAQYEHLKLTPAASTILRVVGGWNEAKSKAGLETYDRGDFGGPSIAPKPDWVTIPDDVQWTEITGYQRWYYKNREKVINKKDERRQELRRWLHEYKREQCSCERCGEEQPACLDFHHVNDKYMEIAEMVVYGYSKESISDEISKCIVLCSNCHRKEHYHLPPGYDEFSSQHS